MREYGYIRDYADYYDRDDLPPDLTKAVRAARLLKDAGHITEDAFAAIIMSIVNKYVPN